MDWGDGFWWGVMSRDVGCIFHMMHVEEGLLGVLWLGCSVAWFIWLNFTLECHETVLICRLNGVMKWYWLVGFAGWIISNVYLLRCLIMAVFDFNWCATVWIEKVDYPCAFVFVRDVTMREFSVAGIKIIVMLGRLTGRYIWRGRVWGISCRLPRLLGKHRSF